MKKVIEIILENKPLSAKYHEHWLTGNYADRKECHIEPDWLLMYKPCKQENKIIFERLGTHSDLFK